VALAALPVTGGPLQVETQLAGLRGRAHRGELLLGEQARLDAHGELDLFGRVQQCDLSDLLQVVLDGVGRGTGDLRRVDRDIVLVLGGEDDRAGRQRLGERRLLAVVVVTLFYDAVRNRLD